MNTTSVKTSRRVLAVLLMAGLSLNGCQTMTSSGAPAEEPIAPRVRADVTDFEPAEYRAAIQAGAVRYRHLYAPESHAIWVTREVNELKLEKDEADGLPVFESLTATADAAAANFVVIECRLESVFADSSIAFDGVGLRNMDVYLETPAAERVYPMQRVMNVHADEAPEQALLRFGRTTVLVFPKRDLMTGAPLSVWDAPSLRLVVEGYHSVFYFEWMAANPVRPESSPGDQPWPGLHQSLSDAVRTGYAELYSTLRPLRGIFD